MDFKEFPKIPRLSREVIVTEKLDGTNASIYIGEDGEFLTGSRTRWITSEDDNYGFAKWALFHKEELLLLGPGMHFGEWWGKGIQRGYGVEDKRFSLFNTSRWGDGGSPVCCRVVPVLWRGDFDKLPLWALLGNLAAEGSAAAPGFMKPEGIIIFHTAGNHMYKKTIEKDEIPKALQGKDEK